MMSDSMQFGPTWLRNLSNCNDGSGGDGPKNNLLQKNELKKEDNDPTSLNKLKEIPKSERIKKGEPKPTANVKYELPEFRYGREEMLMLFEESTLLPDYYPKLNKLFVKEMQLPLTLTTTHSEGHNVLTRSEEKPSRYKARQNALFNKSAGSDAMDSYLDNSNWRELARDDDDKDDLSTSWRSFEDYNKKMAKEEDFYIPEWALQDCKMESSGTFDTSGAFMSAGDCAEKDVVLLNIKKEPDFDSIYDVPMQVDKKELPTLSIEDEMELVDNFIAQQNKTAVSDYKNTDVSYSKNNTIQEKNLNNSRSEPKEFINYSNVSIGTIVQPDILMYDTKPNVELLLKNMTTDMVDKLIVSDDSVELESTENNFYQNTQQVPLQQSLPQHNMPSKYYPNNFNQQTYSLVADPKVLHRNQVDMYLNNKIWFYLDPKNKVQGPFSANEMSNWYNAGFFDQNISVRHAYDTTYITLGELMRLRADPNHMSGPTHVPSMPYNDLHSTDPTDAPSIPYNELHSTGPIHAPSIPYNNLYSTGPTNVPSIPYNELHSTGPTHAPSIPYNDLYSTGPTNVPSNPYNELHSTGPTYAPSIPYMDLQKTGPTHAPSIPYMNVHKTGPTHAPSIPYMNVQKTGPKHVPNMSYKHKTSRKPAEFMVPFIDSNKTIPKHAPIPYIDLYKNYNASEIAEIRQMFPTRYPPKFYKTPQVGGPYNIPDDLFPDCNITPANMPQPQQVMQQYQYNSSLWDQSNNPWNKPNTSQSMQATPVQDQFNTNNNFAYPAEYIKRLEEIANQNKIQPKGHLSSNKSNINFEESTTVSKLKREVSQQIYESLKKQWQQQVQQLQLQDQNKLINKFITDNKSSSDRPNLVTIKTVDTAPPTTNIDKPIINPELVVKPKQRKIKLVDPFEKEKMKKVESKAIVDPEQSLIKVVSEVPWSLNDSNDSKTSDLNTSLTDIQKEEREIKRMQNFEKQFDVILKVKRVDDGFWALTPPKTVKSLGEIQLEQSKDNKKKTPPNVRASRGKPPFLQSSPKKAEPKKKAKKDKKKMVKIEASDLLGFNVMAAENRLNVGDVELPYGDEFPDFRY